MDTHTTPPTPPPLPAHVPAPVDDGGADHLPGMSIPSLELPSTAGGTADLADLARGGLVLYLFPKMGPPGEADPPGWDETPGAYGCTQESCSFRDRHGAIAALGYAVAGLSAQPADEQQEAAGRLHLSFPLLADPERRVGEALGLPTFRIGGMTLYRRLTMVARAGRIAKVFYPVFPPDEHPVEVLAWIRSSGRGDPRVRGGGAVRGPGTRWRSDRAQDLAGRVPR